MLNNYLSKVFQILDPQHKKKFILLFAVILLSMSLETLGISLILPLLSLISAGVLPENLPFAEVIYKYFSAENINNIIIFFISLIFIVYLVKNIILTFKEWILESFNASVCIYLTERLFKTYLSQEYSFHVKKNSAELIRNIISEVGHFNSALLAVCGLITDILLVLGIVTLLFIVEPTGLIFGILFLFICSLIYYLITKNIIVNYGEQRQINDGKRLQELQQGLGGIREVILLNSEKIFLSNFQNSNTKAFLIQRNFNFLRALPRVWLEVLMLITLLIIISFSLISGKDFKSILPFLGLMAAAAFKILPSMAKIIMQLQNLRYTIFAINVLHNDLSLPISEKSIEKNDIKFKDPIISLQNITFKYPSNDRLIIDNINLDIPFGSMTGIVGESGSGKSTIVDILTGLQKPNHGNIYINNELLDNISIIGWRKNIAYVSQNIFLTDASLEENIAFGVEKNKIDNSKILKAIVESQLTEFLGQLPNGLDTYVGERGVKISGGQKQRIGLARALYRNPQILILDEVTSALDDKNEKEILNTIKVIKGSKTIIMISHKESFLRYCDNVYRLENTKLRKEINNEKI